ncbi:glycosyltransferase family protein [Burkholderia multivorans]|uniref:glycosyltransferase family protein n=1 Tax=Burkholderia multivorans TaxID=87883 RepID=UPI001C23A00A|nr:glycosyltransferase [Burkholderia multivorans]MBU9332414.1 glycosyltransferase [Burkholderia multivorans]MBU9411742.1 glycosyltransferase [Burkholderia multivorans]
MNPAKFRILLLDTKYRNPNHYICLAVQGALKRHPDVEFVAKADPIDAMSIADKNHCNLFIAFDGEELDATLCAQLGRACGRAILWVTEDPYEIKVNVRNAKYFDLVFTNDSSSVKEYGAKGHHLPLAGSTEFHSIPVCPADHPLRYQLFFAGTAWPNRSAFLRSILKRFPSDWKCKIALPTNQFLPPHGVDLPDSTLSWRTSPVDFARFVNRSAITLMLPRVFSASGGREFAETPPPRLFEAALAGGAQMIHESLAEVDRSFEPGKEVVLFSSEQDFLEKAFELVNNRSYRNAIAQAARERALEQHTYDCRIHTMLDRAAILPSKPVASERKKAHTLLLVTHNVPSQGNFGGVEVYLDRLKQPLGKHWKILFYAPDMKGRKNTVRVLSSNYEELARHEFSTSYSPALLTCGEREHAFRQVLHDYGVDLVHFHHFVGHVPSLVHVAKHLGIPTAFTAHDFFGVCHEFNLLSYKREFCGAPDVSISQCDVCLGNKYNIANGSQAARRNFWNEALRHLDMLVFNTQYSHRTFAQIYPAVRQHAHTRVLPVPIPDGGIQRQQRAPQPLKIALLGNLTFQKGGDVLARALPSLATAPVEFHIFGRVDPQYSGLSNQDKHKNVIVHGAYDAGKLPDALRECQVSLHISIWPETYCLTLSEAWQLGLVPIVADIGALGERVMHMVNGIKIKPNDEGALIDSIHALANAPALLESLRSGAIEEHYSQLSEHTELLLGEYSALIGDRPRALTNDVPLTHPSIRELGVVLPSPNWQLGTTQSTIGSSYLTQIRRLHHFYKTNGLRPTVRILANRIRTAR